MSKLPALLVTVSLSLVACGGGQARPLPPEEPMDKSGDATSSSASTSSATTAAATPTSADDSAADPSAAFVGAGGGTPTAATTPDPAPDPKGKGKGKGSKGGKGGELSAAECDQISDHEMDVVIASTGIDPSMKEMLKQQAAGNPNLAGMKNECLKNGTRAQYKCMMAAQSKAEMGKCDGK